MPIGDARNTPSGLGLLAAYLVVAAGVVAAVPRLAPDERYRVQVPAARVDARLEAEAELRGAPLTDAEAESIRAQVAEEAVLRHEAEARGLHLEDPLIRSALLGSIATELCGDLPAPTDDEVLAYFHAHRERWGERPFEEVETSVRMECEWSARQAAVAAELPALRRRYDVRRESGAR